MKFMEYVLARQTMVSQQLRTTGVLNEKVLAVMGTLPREAFVASTWQTVAYADTYLPIGHEQVMLEPKEQGRIVQALAIQPQDVVLEIGTGTGYFTAILAQLAKFVYSIEIFPDFVTTAQARLQQLNIDNVQLINDDAYLGWQKYMPYDVICITAAVPEYPENFKMGLKVGGRLCAIVGNAPAMYCLLITRTGDTTWEEVVLFETSVPLIISVEKSNSFKF